METPESRRERRLDDLTARVTSLEARSRFWDHVGDPLLAGVLTGLLPFVVLLVGMVLGQELIKIAK